MVFSGGLLDEPVSCSRSVSRRAAQKSPVVSRRTAQNSAREERPQEKIRPFNRERKPSQPGTEERERLAKVLATVGVASRRACEEIIFAGRVTLNGKVCKVPQTKVDPEKDSIYVDGRSIPKRAPPKFCFAVNKPKGYICSTVSSGAAKPATELVDEYMKVWEKRNVGVPKPRLFTIGRLDVNTTGLLIVTNDGDLAQEVSHPSSGLTKEYIATVGARVTRRQLASLGEGVEVDGVHCTPVEVELLPPEAGDERHRIRIVVSEGRNREVRTLVASAGLELKALKRVRIGGLNMNRKLAMGKFEVVSPAQIRNLIFGRKDTKRPLL